MVGVRFGRLTVLGRAPKIDQYARFRCRCDCGSLTEVRGAHLTAGQTSGSDIAFARSFPIGVIARQRAMPILLRQVLMRLASAGLL
jgi:hypothetical protein